MWMYKYVYEQHFELVLFPLMIVDLVTTTYIFYPIVFALVFVVTGAGAAVLATLWGFGVIGTAICALLSIFADLYR